MTTIHPVFAPSFADWWLASEALSALPDAPVVPDRPRRRRWSWAPRSWLARRRAPAPACSQMPAVQS